MLHQGHINVNISILIKTNPIWPQLVLLLNLTSWKSAFRKRNDFMESLYIFPDTEKKNERKRNSWFLYTVSVHFWKSPEEGHMYFGKEFYVRLIFDFGDVNASSQCCLNPTPFRVLTDPMTWSANLVPNKVKASNQAPDILMKYSRDQKLFRPYPRNTLNEKRRDFWWWLYIY